MRKILSTIVLASAAFLPTGCGSSQTQDAEKNDAETGAIIQTEEGLEMVELSKVPLPCTKEKIYAAWKQIGRVEGKKGKMLDYRQTPLTLFISTDLDGDETPEILLRGEAPCAAIFTYAKDSLQLITFVDHPKYYAKALNSAATVVLINKEVVCPEGKALLLHPDPFDAFVRLMRHFRPFEPQNQPISESATIGEGTHIMPGSFVGHHTVIGKNCLIHPNVTIYDHCVWSRCHW